MTPGKEEKKKAPARESRRAALNRELLGEVRTLQADMHELLERYEMRVGGALNELVVHLEGDASLDQPPRPTTIRTAQGMLEAIRETRIRPRKARARDLRNLEKLVGKLGEMTAEE
jgi:hypothetical protein